MEPIGQVNSIPIEQNVEWVIPNFLSLSGEDEKGYYSPTFTSKGKSWHLIIHPNGEKRFNSIGCVDLHLIKQFPSLELNQNFSLSLKNVDGKKVEEEDYTHVFKKDKHGFGSCCFIPRSELLKRKEELLPADTLTVICTLKYRELAGNANDRCSCQDFKEMLSDGLSHDIILKVGDKELRAHRDVLRARSQVFKCMLSHDMTEKNTGVIDIPDCDPQAMEQFLLYIYAGKNITLEESNVLNLYYIADKYDMKGLIEDCSEFINKTLSVNKICEVIQLALNHTDIHLLECARKYFRNNMLDIMRTVGWQSFMKDNFTEANEFLIKCLEKQNNVKTSI